MVAPPTAEPAGSSTVPAIPPVVVVCAKVAAGANASAATANRAKTRRGLMVSIWLSSRTASWESNGTLDSVRDTGDRRQKQQQNAREQPTSGPSLDIPNLV